MRVWRTASLLALMSALACSPFADDMGATTTRPPGATTAAPATTLPLVAGCPAEGQFVEDGDIAVNENQDSDSTAIGHISWATTEACETFAISFMTSEGAPATTPPSLVASYIDGSPVVRIRLGVDQTVVTDQLVESRLVDRLFVVRSLDGGMFIDLYLAAPAQAKVATSWSPALITLSLQPGIVDPPPGPRVNDLVVLVAPLDKSTQSSPVLVQGYARTFESTVLVIATSGNSVAGQTVTTAADSVDTWGEFKTSLDIGPGPITLFVGEESPQDGSLEGVTINLTVR